MRRLLLVLAVVSLMVLGTMGTRALGDTGAQDNASSWVNPTVRTLRLLGPAPDVPDQPNFQSNLDCSELSYHLTTDSTMRSGCFVSTAYGMLEPDSELAIFNGTDEAIPLEPYTAHQVLTPWPNAVDTLALTATNTGGSYIALYKDITNDLQDERDLSARLNAKQLTAPPDISLTGPDGQPLVVNAQTIAFSDDGSWLVAETLSGSFVRINLATLDMTAFAPSFSIQGNPSLLKSQVAISEDGRYVAIENAAASSFKLYDLATCTGPARNLAPMSCSAYDYWPFVSAQITGLRTIAHVRFVDDELLSFYAGGIEGVTNSYELAPASSINALIDYLALGDSYTSGEGAFDYEAGTDTGDDMCHLSTHSYPRLIAAQLFSSGHSVACSGAKTPDLLPSQPKGYRGQTAGGIPRDERSAGAVAQILANFAPGYLAQADFVTHYQPGIVTVSVGGDDIGFGEMVQNCVEPHISLHLSDSTCYDTYEDRIEIKNLIDRTVPKWTTFYKHLQTKSPGSKLYVIGYPQIAVDDGNCALNVHLSKSELEFAEEVVSYLNGAIQEAASDAGVSYIDISQALAGHRLCETDAYNVAMNGLTAGTDGGPLGLKIFGKESYHPNALGQNLIAAAILKQSHNLQPAATSTGTGSANSSQDLLNAPKSGRVINTLVPDNDMTDPVIGKGANVALQVDGLRDGLRPNDTYSIRLDGASGPTIGTLSTDSGGSLNGSSHLPVNESPGGHTIDVTGEGQGGEPIDVTQPIYVPVSTDDADGDGVPDTSDSCPGAANSGHDADGDGVDDACDSLIGPPPASSNSASNSGDGIPR